MFKFSLIKKISLLSAPIYLFALNAPSDLVLTPSLNSVSIKWNYNSDDETGFKIYRDNKLIGYTKSGVYSYNDKGLKPQTTYKYTIKATTDTIPNAIKSTKNYDILRYSYDIQSDAQPFDNNLDHQISPKSWSNRYSRKREFFPINYNNNLGIVWQDQIESSSKVFYSKFSTIDNKHEEIKLINENTDDTLAAATNDDNGNIYYLMIQRGSGRENEIARRATIYKVDNNGNLILKKRLDTSKNGLNIIEFTSIYWKWAADLKYTNGTLGLMLERTMHKSSDNLNHQGGIAVVFDSSTLDILKNLGQTSGHSFENYLTTNSKNEFIGIDLGDNYPRGINLHKFTENGLKKNVIYSFKTSHGTTKTNPAGSTFDKYEDISTDIKTYYKWSNDNNTYTELGAVIELDDGNYLVTFVGEPDKNGYSINNARVGKYLNDPRNVAFVKVSSDLREILSNGINETGGFYTFNGWWSSLSNKGIVWLTSYTDNTKNASRIKSVKLGNGNIAILWELWDISYISTHMMIIDSDGNIVKAEQDLGNQVRLSRRDDPIVTDKQSIVIFSGNKDKNDIEITKIILK